MSAQPDDLTRLQSAAKPAADEPSPLGSTVLMAVLNYLGRFVAYPSEHAQVAHALWIAHTHLMGAWDTTPRIAFLSPEPGSGKTRALEITEPLVPRPVQSVNVSPAYLFRKVSDVEGLPTILFDEIDTIFGAKAGEHEEIRGFINAGHRRGAVAGRCVVRGKNIETEDLPAYCAIAMAGLGNLPDTILSRAVVVRMRRRAPGETVEPFRSREHTKDGNDLRAKLETWAATVRERIGKTWPTMPEGVEDRNADVWEALLAVADAAGGDWPDRAREAAKFLVGQARQDTPSLGLRLLADVKKVFEEEDKNKNKKGGQCESLFTSVLLQRLVQQEEAPWGDLRGRPLDARRLASLLKPYGIASKSHRIGAENAKGYERADFADAWGRYLTVPASSADGVTSVTAVTQAHANVTDVTGVTGVTGNADDEREPHADTDGVASDDAEVF